MLRGVGFRSGTYSDLGGVLPLTGAPVTEINAPHPSFASPVQYPQTLATPNYYGSLATGGKTLLQVTPAQYVTTGAGPLATQRTYSQLGLQLYYSGTRRPTPRSPPTARRPRPTPRRSRPRRRSPA